MNFVTTNTLIPFAAFFVALLLLVILTGARKRTLAYFIAYLALPAWLGSWSALALVLILIVMLLLVKLIEEKELKTRFGAEYLEYKRTTPFFILHLLKERWIFRKEMRIPWTKIIPC